MTPQEKAQAIVKLLKQVYPDTRLALNFANPLELLIATVLSAQCTDERTNRVTKVLFKKYRTVRDYANADLNTLEKDIRPTGFYKNKAKNIISACQKIIKEFNGRVPQKMHELITLPGVGRKTANIVLSFGFGKVEGIAVDTHVGRLSQRLGLSKSDKPEKIELDLMRVVPKKDWAVFDSLMIEHGRKTCLARKPLCENCVLKKLCPSFKYFTK